MKAVLGSLVIFAGVVGTSAQAIYNPTKLEVIDRGDVWEVKLTTRPDGLRLFEGIPEGVFTIQGN